MKLHLVFSFTAYFLLTVHLAWGFQELQQVITYYDSEAKIQKEKYYIADNDSARIQGVYELYYSTTPSIKKRLHYAMGIKQGTGTEYYEDGKRKLQYFYQNDQKHGDYKKWDRKGNLQVTCRFEKGKIEGVMNKYYEKTRIAERHFKDGKREGIAYDYHQNGKIMWELFYKNDSLSGKANLYDTEGNLKQTVHYFQNTLHGTATNFYTNGTIEKVSFFDMGLLHGTVKEYYISGIPKRQTPYDKGKENGWILEFYEAGNLKSKTEFQRGQPSGELKEFYKNGTKKLEVTQDTVQKSEFRFYQYYKEGNLALKGTLVNGVLEGENISFHKTNKIKQKHYYQKGKKVRQSTYYSPEGILTKKVIYLSENQNRISEYFDNGILKTEGTTEDGKQTGVWKQYTSLGKIKTEGFYQMGKKEGIWKSYFENSTQIEWVKRYKKNQLEGLTETYYPTGILKSSYPYSKNVVYGTVYEYHNQSGQNVKATGRMYKNLKLDTWRYYDKQGKLTKTEIYKKGKLMSKEEN